MELAFDNKPSGELSSREGALVVPFLFLQHLA